MWSQVSSVQTGCVLGWDGRCPVCAQIQPGARAGKVTRSPLLGRVEMDWAMLKDVLPSPASEDSCAPVRWTLSF